MCKLQKKLQTTRCNLLLYSSYVEKAGREEPQTNAAPACRFYFADALRFFHRDSCDTINKYELREWEEGRRSLIRKSTPIRWKSAVSAFLAIWLLFVALGSHAAVGAEAKPSIPIDLKADAAILIDADTGQVLYELNADTPRPPASMTKLMTEYIVLEEISNNRLSWDQTVTTTKEAASTPKDGSQIYLAEGDKHTVEELYIAMAVGSANDATVALASHISGSEQAFAEKMNETAKALGLESAHFTSATGLAETTVISARDMAKLAQIILKKHPEFLKYSSIPSYKFRERDQNPMVNYNWMLGANKDTPSFKPYAYEGVDGMKTGYISAAGYTFTGTVKRGDIRLISVVMGTASKGARFIETAKLYDYAFNNLEKKTAVKANSVVESLESINIKKGVSKKVPVVTGSDISLLVPKGAEPKVELVSKNVPADNELVAPIEKGQKIGTVTFEYKDPNSGATLQRTVDLVAAEEVKKASWWRLLFRGIGDFFVGLFNGIANLF